MYKRADCTHCWKAESLRRLFKAFAQCWHPRTSLALSRKFLRFCLSRSLKAIKKQWARFGLWYAVLKITKMIFVIKLRLYKWRPLPVIIWLCLWFTSMCFSEISQNLWNLSCQSFKGQKRRGYKGSFLTTCKFVFSSCISNLV